MSSNRTTVPWTAHYPSGNLYLFKVLPNSYPYSRVKNAGVWLGEAVVVKYYGVMQTDWEIFAMPNLEDKRILI